MEESGSSVSNLIHHLNRLREGKSYIIDSVQDFDLLISTLREIDLMVEMKELKDSIVKQIKFLLINNSTVPSSKIGEKIVNSSVFDGHMLHTVIYGPPGVGKTRVCTILVKIWLALGIIKQPSVNKTDDNEVITIFPNETPPVNNHTKNTNEDYNKIHENIKTLISLNKIKSDVIEKLQTCISDLKSQIMLINPDIHVIKTKLRKLKRLHFDVVPKSKSKHDNIYDRVNSRPVPTTNTVSIDDILLDLEDIEARLREESEKYIPDEKIDFVVQVINLEQPKLDLPPVIVNEPSVTKTESQPLPVSPDSLVKIVGRDDFVGGFLGQTALKTEKLLRESLGKVLFIDEAYSLVNDEKDSYGREALTVLNRFMSEHPDEIIVIFAGYRKMMEQTIFTFQPGLKSRCTWMFEIEGYTEVGLSKIFKQQLHQNKWKLSEDVKLVDFFKRNKDEFPAYGRDTNRLVFYCKTCYTEFVFDNESDHNKTITKEILKNALVYLRNNRIKDSSETNISHLNIYI